MTELDGAAGVMVTASHNPPADNGYKVYLGDGAQIVPPHDTGISARIEQVEPTAVTLADERRSADRAARRVDRRPLRRLRPRASAGGRIRPASPVAYTPMHGVGGELVCRAFEAAGLPAPLVVEQQFAPDPHFPTVQFPNPEEPGAMDLVHRARRASGARRSPSPTIPTPTGSGRRSRSPTARGGASAATSSGGCSPTTSSATRSRTTAS